MRAILFGCALPAVLLALPACGGSSAPLSHDFGTEFDGPVTRITPATDGGGDIYVGGGFTTYRGAVVNGLVRINADGSRDAGFDVGTGFDGPVWSIAPATDGSGDVYVGGGGAVVNGLVRINADGSRDAGFDVGTGFDSPAVLSIAPAADGSGDIYVGGGFTTYRGAAVNRIVRINADGSWDAGFDVGTGFNGVVHSIAPAADGSGDIYVGGGFTTYRGAMVNRIVRINADGSRDTGFDIGTGFDDAVGSVAPVTGGSDDIYVGGFFTTYRGATANGIVRINADGSRDAGFDVGTGLDDATVVSIAPAADGSGDIYVGGGFTTYRGAVVNRIVRINADGSRDVGFDVGTGFNEAVHSIAPAADGSGDIYVGGSFTSYSGAVANRIARLNPDGTLD